MKHFNGGTGYGQPKARFLLAGLIIFGWLARLQGDTSLVFNEIMYHPQTNETGFEWVEFYNQMAVDLDISGWSIQNGISYTFPQGTFVRGGGHIVVAISPADLMPATGLTNVLGPFSGRLSNAGETLELHNNDNRLIDSVTYGTDGDWPVGPDGAGVSLAKLDPNTASAPPENWVMSLQVGGTPGMTNFPVSVVNGDQSVVLNEIAAATNAVFWLELFNYGTNDVSIANYVLNLQGSTNVSYTFPGDATLSAGAFLTLDQTQLGFRGTSGDRLFLYPAARDRIVDAVVVKDKLRGRSPDGTGQWRHPNLPTPGASNSFFFHREIVINEIMYDHSSTQSVAGLVRCNEQWIELYNRSSNTVDLTGWIIDGGIQFSFAAGQTMAPGSYLVVAKQSADLGSLYPSINIVGDFSKALSHHNDTIVLKDPNGDPLNKLHYYDDGRWPALANRGGSSLELRDPWADNSKAEAWAASDESQRSGWSNYTYTTVAGIDGGPTLWHEFVLGLLSDGACLVDDISVQELLTNQQPTELVANGDFENDITGWRVLGNHNRTKVEVDPDNPANHVLRVVATGPTEHMHNQVQTTYIGNRSITNGNLYRVSFRAKWLWGVNLLNTRLYFNRVHQTSVLPVPPRNGTPGAQNSRFETNIGPTFSQFQHRPVVPNPGQDVTVSVRAQDPQGVSACSVWWSVNGGAWSNAPMAAQSNGLCVGAIPGLPADTVVQFYVQATDGLGVVSTFPSRGPDSRALYRVNDGLAASNLGHNIRVIMTPADVGLLDAATNVMSNDNLGATVITDEERPYYDMTLRLKSSERGRLDPSRVGLHLSFNAEDLFRGVHSVMLIDRSGVNGGFGQTEIVVKHMMSHAGGIPQVYNDIAHVIGPVDAEAGSALFFPRFEDEFLNAQYPTGGDGNLYEYELIYFPLTTDDGTPTGYKLAQPDAVIGVDISDLGNDKEDYRYHYIIKNNRELDDYSRLMELCKTFSQTGAVLDAQSQRVMDVDEWLRTFVMEALCGVNEIYNAADDDNSHNALIYIRSSDQKVVTFPWDADWCFIAPYFTPLYGDKNLSKIITLPANLRAYYAHALDMIDTTYNASYMSYWVSHYNSFCPGQDFSYITPYIDQRATYLQANLARYATNAFALTISNFTSTSSDFLMVTGSAPVQVRSILVNGVAYPVTWISVTNWTLTLPLNPGTNLFQVQGYDARGNLLTNGSLSFAANYIGAASSPVGAVVINEIMYNPLVPDASFVEIFNTSSNAAFDLTGWRLDGVGFTFPPMVITKGQFIVLAKDWDAFASAYGNTIRPAALFGGRLDPTGEILSLIKPGATPAQDLVVDRVRYDAAAPWPEAANGGGASLQLIDPSQDRSRVSNWAAVPGVATPGAVNSIFTNLPAYPPLWINEVQPDNISGITDNNGKRDSWLEIYNKGTDPISLNGFYLANNYTNLAQWSFPTGTVLNGGEFKVIFTDGQPEQSTATELHTSFRLSSVSGSIALARMVELAPQLLDYINYAQVHSNLSFGSFPDGQPFYRQEMYFVTPGAPNNGTSPPGGVFINEWMASNTGFIRDPADNATDDWFELYNPGTSPLNLAGYYLTGNLTDKFKFQIPSGYVIPALGFLLVWADNTPSENSPSRPDLHVNFALSKSGDSIGLFAADGTQIDAITFGLQTNNISQGRYPDGDSSIFYMTNPTPRSPNLPPFLNRAPVLGAISNQIIFGGQTLSLTISATDTDQPPQTLTFSLDAGAPAGSSIDLISGLLTWTPAPSQVPSTNIFTVRVTDNGTPNLSATRSFEVFVYKVNSAPTLAALDDQTINELTLLTVTNTASDPDLPDTVLTYSFLDAPAGASIDTNGIITWIPSEAHGPGSYTLTTVVTDSGYPSLSATNHFSVSVNEVNSAPVLTPIANRTINEEMLLTFTNSATDSDLPTNSLTFSLAAGAPAGAAVDAASGVFTWTPTEAQGPSNYVISVVVTDNGVPPLSDSRTFHVQVNEVNSAPVLAPIGGQSVTNGGTLTFNATATDLDIPANILTFSLDAGAPTGAVINPSTGDFTWSPNVEPGLYPITARVTDNGTPPLSASKDIVVTVYGTNIPLTLVLITNVWKHDESGSDLGTGWRETNFNDSAWSSGAALLYHTKANLQAPKNTELSLTNAAGQPIITYYFRTHFFLPSDATGVTLISSNLIDDGAVFYLNGVEAARYNMPTGIINNTTFAASTIGNPGYTEADLLTAALIAGTNLLAVEVHQASSNSNDIVFGMGVLAIVPSQTRIGITDQPQDVSVLVGGDAQFAVGISGSSPRYQWFKNGVAIAGANNATYTITNAQFGDAGSYSVGVTNLVSSAASHNATLTVNPLANAPPTLRAISNQTVNEGSLLSFTATATDTDAPPQTLRFTLDPGAPSGATITTNGSFTWSPAESDGPGSYPVTVRVIDNGSPPLSATGTFTITVIEVNSAPTLPVIADRTILPVSPLTVTNTASDSDLPANTLTYTMVDPPTGASVDSNGIITWTSAESQAPGSYTFTTIVTDSSPSAVNAQHLSATNTFHVSVSAEPRPLFALLTAADGGTISLQPPGGEYPLGSVIQLTANPASGWIFLGWRGDLDGTNAVASIIMNGIESVRALFGTMLETEVSGDGTISLYPTNRLCPFGSTVQLVGIPGTNSFLSTWNVTSGTNLVSTVVNPIRYSVVHPMVTFEAVFQPLVPGQATLSVIPNGRGEVIIDPEATHYNVGSVVHLQAVPDPGQRFMGWTGDAAGTISNLDVSLNQSKTVTANFSKRPRLDIISSIYRLTNEPLHLIVSGDAGTDYEIQGTLNLTAWTNVAVVNSPFGNAQITDALSTNLPRRSYRAVSPPGYVPPPPTILVATGSAWKYLDNGSDQGTAWNSSSFNDSSWAAGLAQLGYGDGDENTVVSFGSDEFNKYITTYFRHSFNVTNASSFDTLTLRILRDDGAVVYLNGVEVVRSNMPEGAIAYTALAATTVSSIAESTFYPYAIDPYLLINGTNVLAVEIHQADPGSSDCSFDLELVGQTE